MARPKKLHRIIQINICKPEDGLWYDRDIRKYDPKGWGVCFKIWCGKMIRPIPKFWIKGSNPWQGDEPWFVIRIPWMPAFFLSVALWKYGFYFGFKGFEVANKHRKRYWWLREDEFGTDENPSEYLQLSATIRKTRWV